MVWTTPGTPIYRTFERDLGCRTPDGYMDWLSWLDGTSVGHTRLVFVRLCIAGGSTDRRNGYWIRIPSRWTFDGGYSDFNLIVANGHAREKSHELDIINKVRNTQVKMTINQAGPNSKYYLAFLQFPIRPLKGAWSVGRYL